MLVRFMWLLRRLSVMSGAEIVYRLRQQGAVMAMRLAYRGIGRKKPRVKDPKSLAFCAAADPQLPELPWDEDFSADEERALLTGRWHALGCAWSWTPDPMVWHRAPDTNQLWPQRFFAAIDYRPGNPFGDARIVWEPSRLQQLVSLGLIARQAATRIARDGGGEGGRERGDGGERAADLLCRQLRSWVAANPPFHGIHYASAMECGLRIFAVCHAMDFVRSAASARGTWPAVVNLVQSHADLIARRLSLYSSRGNHTVAEAAGLVYAGVLFPEMEGSERWRRTGLALLEAEADHQILEDGGGAEQAFWYLAFVLDLYGLVIRLMESRGCEVAFSITAAFARGRAFLTTMAGPQGRIPPIGDGDDGFALSSRIRLWWDPGCRENRSGLESRSFQWSGYTVVIDHDAGPWVVVLDHGPLGMPPSYGHGHADALALTVAVGDREVLVDPGTYAYGREDGWRRYFSGTRAHNTVCVDGRDQARRRGPFLWAEPYNASLVRREEMAEGGVRLLAHHTRYGGRYGGKGVDHWRGVVYRSWCSRGTLMVWDCFTGEGVHELELNWHCNGEITEVGASKAMMLAELDATMTLTGGRISRHSGESDPPRGWRAPGYGRRVPITTLTATATTSLPHEFLTIVALAPLSERALAKDVEIFRSWLP